MIWKLCRIALTVGVLVTLLAALVSLAILYLAVTGVPGQAVPGLSGLGVSLFAAWMLGKGVTLCRRRANDLGTDAHAEAMLNDHTTDAVAHFNDAIVHVMSRRYAEAVAHFDVAIRLDPNMANAYVGRVNAYFAMGQVERIIAEYTEMIRVDPTNAMAYCARATAYNAIGRFDLSIPDADEAIRLSPHSYLGYDARGFGLLQRGSFNLIVKLIAIAWWVLSFGYWRRDSFDLRTPTGSRTDFKQAVADFSEGVRLNPKALDCYQGRSRAYQALGEHDKAASDVAVVRAGLARII